jgi:integrase/recombinase XerD
MLLEYKKRWYERGKMLSLAQRTSAKVGLRVIEDELGFEVRSFLRAKEFRSEGTVRNYGQKLGIWVSWLETQGIQTLQDVRPALVRDFFSHLRETGHNPGGVHLFYRVIKVFVRWYAREYDLVGWDPLKNVEAPRLMSVPMPTTPIEDLVKMIKTCDRKTYTGVRDEALLRFLVDTGVRASELLRLEWGDIDILAGDVRLRAEATKGKKERMVFLGTKAQKALRAYMRVLPSSESDLVWVGEGGEPLKYWGLRSIFTRRGSSAGLDPIPTPHSVRKTYATESYRHGEELETLRRKLGHSSLLVTQRYLGLQVEDLREASHLHSPGDRLL